MISVERQHQDEIDRWRAEVVRLLEYGRQIHALALRQAAELIRMGDDGCTCRLHVEHVDREEVVKSALRLKTAADAYRKAFEEVG